MKLMTPQLEQAFIDTGKQGETVNPILVTRYYNPAGAGQWYPIEYDPKTGEFFGYVIGFLDQDWKVFTLDDLENFEGLNGTRIKHDTNFPKTRFRDMPEY